MIKILFLILLITNVSCKFQNETKKEIYYSVEFQNFTGKSIDWVHLSYKNWKYNCGFLNKKLKSFCCDSFISNEFPITDEMVLVYYNLDDENERPKEENKVILKAPRISEDYWGKKILVKIYVDKVEIEIVPDHY